MVFGASPDVCVQADPVARHPSGCALVVVSLSADQRGGRRFSPALWVDQRAATTGINP